MYDNVNSNIDNIDFYFQKGFLLGLLSRGYGSLKKEILIFLFWGFFCARSNDISVFFKPMVRAMGQSLFFNFFIFK